MKLLGFAVVGAVLVAVAAPCQAQQQRGDNEFQLQGSLSLATSGSQTADSGAVDVRYGRFLTDYQQVGVEVTGTITGGPSLFGSVGPFYRYNFSKDKLVPYVGGGVTVLFGTQGGNGGELNVEGGVRYFYDRHTAFTVSATTGYTFNNHTFGKTIAMLFGFSHLW
jgi:hypothetical protein